MNNQKTGGAGRIIAFFVIATALALMLGAASGKGVGATENGRPDQNENMDNPPQSSPEIGDEPTAAPEPSYRYNYLTGLKEDTDTPNIKPIAYVMSTDAALYGVSFADVLLEIPVEEGNTRLLAICPYNAQMGKIGAISPTRRYISGLAESFGSTLISYGNDDTKIYTGINASENLDLTLQAGYHYTEYTTFAYSNSDLLKRALANSGLAITAPTVKLPYEFIPEEETLPSSSVSARKITLPYSVSDKTELFYSESDGYYTIAKGGSALYDMLNGTSPSFKNVFILYADSVTYETSSQISFVMDTATSGKGLYITDGHASTILWDCSETGEMSFFSESGAPLSVNRGKSYVAFFKASLSSAIEMN